MRELIEKLEQIRLDRGMTKVAFVKKLGISVRMYDNLLRDERRLGLDPIIASYRQFDETRPIIVNKILAGE